MTQPTRKWTKPPPRSGHVAGYRPQKPFRFTDWAAI